MQSRWSRMFVLTLALAPLVAIPRPAATDVQSLNVVLVQDPATPATVDELDSLEVTFEATEPDETGIVPLAVNGTPIPGSVPTVPNPAPPAHKATVPLLLLPPGSHTVDVTVTSSLDAADVDVLSVPVTVVIPDVPTLALVVERMGTTAPPLIRNRGQVQRLLSALASAQRFLTPRGRHGRVDEAKAIHHLGVFKKKVSTQAGRHIHPLAAAKLLADADALIADLSTP